MILETYDERIISNLFSGRVAITEPELCKALCISRRTALRLRLQHKLGCFEDGRKITYGARHISAYLDSISRTAF